ncbi:MAG TPA: hypothetical protein VLL03_05945 [Burkholderiales bacterium]|nr:hypothetical protein [Burkholderiales bacterium]
MRINITAFSLAAGLFWGGAIIVTGVANLIWPSYGQAFLELAASIYPGYHAGANIGQVIIGALYGLVDGAVGGFVFGWLYNSISHCLPGKTA